jgi:hypothetical protein
LKFFSPYSSANRNSNTDDNLRNKQLNVLEPRDKMN